MCRDPHQQTNKQKSIQYFFFFFLSFISQVSGTRNIPVPPRSVPRWIEAARFGFILGRHPFSRRAAQKTHLNFHRWRRSPVRLEEWKNRQCCAEARRNYASTASSTTVKTAFLYRLQGRTRLSKLSAVRKRAEVGAPVWGLSVDLTHSSV